MERYKRNFCDCGCSRGKLRKVTDDILVVTYIIECPVCRDLVFDSGLEINDVKTKVTKRWNDKNRKYK